MFTDDGIPPAVAAAKLKSIWMIANQKEKVKWQAQLNAELAAVAARAEEATEAQAQREAAEKVKAEQVRKDEVKKNRDKFLPILLCCTPRGAQFHPAPYVVQRLEKGQYVELYFYTNVGLEAARVSVSQIDDKTMVMQLNADGTTSWVPAAAARDPKGIVEDQNLSWEQFMEAAPCMICAMEGVCWDPACIVMLVDFWQNLQLHPFKNLIDAIDTCTLLVYQEEQRKSWHLAILLLQGAWDISILMEDILKETVTIGRITFTRLHITSHMYKDTCSTMWLYPLSLIFPLAYYANHLYY